MTQKCTVWLYIPLITVLHFWPFCIAVPYKFHVKLELELRGMSLMMEGASHMCRFFDRASTITRPLPVPEYCVYSRYICRALKQSCFCSCLVWFVSGQWYMVDWCGDMSTCCIRTLHLSCRWGDYGRLHNAPWYHYFTCAVHTYILASVYHYTNS